MDNGRRKYVLILGTENTRTTSIWNEVFPVTVVSKQAVLIRFHQEKKLPALLLANLPHRHPNDIGLHESRVAYPLRKGANDDERSNRWHKQYLSLQLRGNV